MYLTIISENSHSHTKSGAGGTGRDLGEANWQREQQNREVALGHVAYLGQCHGNERILNIPDLHVTSRSSSLAVGTERRKKKHVNIPGAQRELFPAERGTECSGFVFCIFSWL